ncbi:MAG: transketolase C-terminal domain-containing protein [Armatimonadota bacterium]|jgi:transketolase
MPKAFGEVLADLAREDERIFGVSADCFHYLRPLADAFPGRAIEVGIAEQDLIGIAAGLAVRGKLPFAVGMNPFVTMRCFEQIRTDVGLGRRNVKIVGGSGSGVRFPTWGPTHHAIEEMALMRLIPGMTVLMPADLVDTEAATRAAADINGPVYMALAKGPLPLPRPDEPRPFEVGKAQVLREGGDATIIATGAAVADAVEAGEKLALRAIQACVLNMHTIKPLDRRAVLQVARDTRLIVTVEQHLIAGGLGGAVAEVLAGAGMRTALRRLGFQDAFCPVVGTAEQVKSRLGMGADDIVTAVSRWIIER